MDANFHESGRAEHAPWRSSSLSLGVFCAAVAGSVLFGSSPAHAAPGTDISPAPVTTISAASVKPNLMLLMDASGSMERSHMPDEAESVMGPDKVGYKNSSCNSLYYNPALTYSVPRNADGSFFTPAPTFTSAPYTGFLSYYAVPTPVQLAGDPVLAAWWGKQTSTVDLSTSFMPYDFVTLLVGVPTYPAPEPAYYYNYTGALPLKYDSAPCTDVDTGATRAATGGGNWVKVVVSATSGPGANPDERQNFANWYSYYRIRINMIKSAASLAFAPLTNNVRVGFITVEPKLHPGDAGIDASRYVPIQDFDLAQRTAWFAKLFAQVPGGASPAREGLARVGRHYGGKTDGINTNMNGDPVQYACQQNFTLMTTDGYWNAQTESPGGGPVDLSGNLLGQQDGGVPCPLTDPFCPRPIFDGGASSTDTLTNEVNVYLPSACGNPVTLKSTAQITLAKSQLQKTSVTTQQRTVQYLLSQHQPFARTTQTQKTVTVMTKTVTQYAHETDELHQIVQRVNKDTYQTIQDIKQLELTTDQIKDNTTQTLMTKTRSTEHDEVWSTIKSQSVLTSVQYLQQTDQWRSATSQSYLRIYYTTGCATSEGCTTFSGPCVVGALTVGGNPITSCTDFEVRANAPDPGACVPGPTTYNFNVGAGRWEATSCTAGTTVADHPVQSCTAQAPAPVNGYTTITCYLQPLTPAQPIDVPAAGPCPQPAANAGNNWTITTCSTPGGTNYSNPVASCPALPPYDAADNWVRVTCTQPPGPNNHGLQPDAPCVDGSINTDGNFVTTECHKTTDNTFPVATGSCTNLAPVGPTYLQRTCTDLPLATNQPVASASCPLAFSFDGIDSTTCTTSAIAPYAAPTPVPACPADTGVSPFIENHCTPIHTNNFVASCPSGLGSFPANAGNAYTASDCHYAQNFNDYQDPTVCGAAASTGLTPPYVTATCTTANAVAPVPVDPTTCTLGTTTTGTYPFVTTHCAKEILSDTIVPAALCVYDPPTLANGWQETLCTHEFNTVAVQGPCAIGTDTGVNPDGSTWTCVAGALNAPTTNVTACTSQVADISNSWATIDCTGPTTVSGPTPVNPASCVDGSVDALQQVTHCTTVAGTYPVATPVGACVPGYDAVSGEFFFCTTPNDTVAHGVASCDDVTNGGVNTDPVTHITTTCVKSDTTTNVPTCTAAGPVAGNQYKDITCPGTTAYQTADPVAACSVGAVSAVAPFETTTQCNTVSIVAQGPAPACTNAAPIAGNGYVATICGSTPILTDVVDAACAPGTDATGIVTSCTPGIPGAGTQFDVTTTTTVTTTARSNGVVVGVPSVSTSSSTAPYNAGVCYPNPATTPVAQPPVDDRRLRGMAVPETVGGSRRQPELARRRRPVLLQDRPAPVDVRERVPSAGPKPEDDNAPHQHMTTFAIALGVSGTLNYRSDYRSLRPHRRLRRHPHRREELAALARPAARLLESGQLQQPEVDRRLLAHRRERARHVLQRQAIRPRWCRGSATRSPRSTACSAPGAPIGTSTSAARERQQLRVRDQLPVGDLGRRSCRRARSTSSPATPSAAGMVGQGSARHEDRSPLATTARSYVMRGSSALGDFTWNTDICPARDAVGDARDRAERDREGLLRLAQRLAPEPVPVHDRRHPARPCSSSRRRRSRRNLVNFLRGQRGLEDFETNSLTKSVPPPRSVLGDIVDSQPVFVQVPFANYQDAGYDSFKTSNASRTPMLYVGANDGMLHAFYATLSANPADKAGQEAWAVIPSSVLPNMYKLADEQLQARRAPVLRRRHAGRRGHLHRRRAHRIGRRSSSAASTPAARATTRSMSRRRAWRRRRSGNSRWISPSVRHRRPLRSTTPATATSA